MHIAVLALIQGITEFLPISSHGHLRLVHTVSELRDPGLVIHVAVHVGSLGAVILYFWRDLWAMLDGLVLALRGRWGRGQKLFVTVAVATVPVLIAGYLVQRYADVALYSTAVIAWSTFGFAIVLYLADRFGMTIRRIEHMRVGPALAIGLAQVVALVPGTSPKRHHHDDGPGAGIRAPTRGPFLHADVGAGDHRRGRPAGGRGL